MNSAKNRKAEQMKTMHDNASVSRGGRANTLLVPCAALALAMGSAWLTGCGGGDDENGGQTAGTTPAQATPAPTPGSSGANSIDAPADDNPRATVEGTLNMFIAAMEDGSFERAVELVDPTTDLHSELLGLIEAAEAASGMDDPNAGNIGNMIRMSFALTFAGAEYEIVSEDESRARATITRPGANNDRHNVDLNRVDGEWFLLAGRQLIRSPGGTQPATPPRPTR